MNTTYNDQCELENKITNLRISFKPILFSLLSLSTGWNL